MSFLSHFILLVILASAFGGPRPPFFKSFPRPPFLRQQSQGECTLPMVAEKIMDVHNEIMKPLKKFMEDDNKRCMCADVEMPMELRKIHGKCFMKTMKESQIFKKIMMKTVDKDDFIDDLDNMEQCVLDAHDISEVTETTIAEKFQFKNWFGSDKGKEDLDRMTQFCYGEITGDTREEQMRSFCDCLTNQDLEICIRDDIVPPSPAVLSIVMKSLREESSPCENVEFDITEHYDQYITCLETEQVRISESTIAEQLMEEKNEVKNVVLVAQTFLDANINAMKCYSEGRNFYDPGTNRYNHGELTNYITELPGMEDLPVPREMLLNAGKRCGKYINEDVDEESGMAFEVKRKCKWDRCMLTAFTKTCGINNDLKYLFFPKLTDQSLRGAMTSLMTQIVGSEKMNEMKLQLMKMGHMMMKMRDEEDM